MSEKFVPAYAVRNESIRSLVLNMLPALKGLEGLTMPRRSGFLEPQARVLQNTNPKRVLWAVSFQCRGPEVPELPVTIHPIDAKNFIMCNMRQLYNWKNSATKIYSDSPTFSQKYLVADRNCN